MRVLFVILVLLAGLAPVAAQDNKARAVLAQQQEELDQLFGKLQNKNIGSEALRTESRIWALWMAGGTDAENKTLEQATIYMVPGQFERSLSILNQLIQQTQAFPEAYNKRATLYYLMGKYDESLADIVSVLELEPRHFGALSGKGMILARQGKTREALVSYREALSMNPHMFGVIAAIKQLEQIEPDL